MLRMSKEADYGIVLLAHVARQTGPGLQSARGLAASAGLPAPTVSKILKHLARAGLLRSQRGVRGGYRLARPPAEITVAEIIAGLEGPIGVTECTPAPEGACAREDSCPTRSPMGRVNRAVAEALRNVTLAEVARSARPAAAARRRPAPRTIVV